MSKLHKMTDNSDRYDDVTISGKFLTSPGQISSAPSLNVDDYFDDITYDVSLATSKKPLDLDELDSVHAKIPELHVKDKTTASAKQNTDGKKTDLHKQSRDKSEGTKEQLKGRIATTAEVKGTTARGEAAKSGTTCRGLLTPDTINKENRSHSPTLPGKKTKLKDKFKGKLNVAIAKEEVKPVEETVKQTYQPVSLDLTIRVTKNSVSYDIGPHDLKIIKNLGRGAYGVVDMMRHRDSQITMAVKRIAYTSESSDYKSLLMDLNVSMRAADCPNIVHFFGALFAEGDVWICMEVMDTSLDKFYKMVYQNGLKIEEDVLAKIVLGVTKGLNYLKTQLRVIHRDVKPSNILADREGHIKLCDFSVSGTLVDSLSKTKIGAQHYMAPEKINPAGESYFDVRSDIWSLGISLIEMSTGKFPYETWKNVFDQIKQVVYGVSPSLPKDAGFSPEIQDFVNKCLQKDYRQRPKYPALLEHPFIANADATNIAPFITLMLDKFAEES